MQNDFLVARGTSPEPSYIGDLSRQWVFPNSAIFELYLLLFALSLFARRQDYSSLAIMELPREDKKIARVSF